MTVSWSALERALVSENPRICALKELHSKHVCPHVRCPEIYTLME